jgi:uncharacterized membrane protein
LRHVRADTPVSKKVASAFVWNGSNMPLLLVFLLGVVSGLRTFTAPAVLWVMRYGGVWAYVLAAAALFEYTYDVNPKAPSRLAAFGMMCRILSGLFVGWFGAAAAGVSPVTGAVLGAAGAIAGAYASYALRKRCSAAVGNVPSGLLEDAFAIIASALIVSRL